MVYLQPLPEEQGENPGCTNDIQFRQTRQRDKTVPQLRHLHCQLLANLTYQRKWDIRIHYSTSSSPKARAFAEFGELQTGACTYHPAAALRPLPHTAGSVGGGIGRRDHSEHPALSSCPKAPLPDFGRSDHRSNEVIGVGTPVLWIQAALEKNMQ